MSLNIDKKEMDAAWVNRSKSDLFYKYLYDIAKHQVAKKGINYNERSDFIQFCVYKCFAHQEAYKPARNSSTYSFFWKQISLAIIYKQRKEARKANKVKLMYIEQEKILDWMESSQLAHKGDSFKDIVDSEELVLLKKIYTSYNANHKNKLEPTKKNTARIIKWYKQKDPNVLDKFTTLKSIFKNWVEA